LSDDLQAQLALLPEYLGQHLLLTVVALLLGVGLSLPLAVLLTRMRALKGPVLGLASVVQTIPGLALLALMVPLLRTIGFVPAAIALVLYSMLPVIRNTVTGIDKVDPSLIEAGRGLGMSDMQLLMRVQLPLALPVIIAGIRTATVWVVGMATLSTPVGATSLGNYIFSGLQTQNYTAVLVGCVAAAGLALLLDALIRLVEAGVRRRSRVLLMGATTALVAICLAGLAPLLAGNERAEQRPVVIGAKTFTEQYILAELINVRLAAAGFETELRSSLGSTIAFDALRNDEIDMYVDYSGTIWANYMQRDDNPGRAEILAGVRDWLAREHGIVTVVPLGFENAYALATTREAAERLRLENIDDLARVAGQLSIAGDYEFFARPEWQALEQRYGLAFAEQVSMDSTLMYPAIAAGEVDVISAYSTDGRIAAQDLVVLEDPREALPPYDAVLMLSPRATRERPELVRLVERWANRITAEEMRAANRAVDLDGSSVGDAAHQLGAALTVD
jgi:osmoprotectant transport system permease protein